MASIVDKAYPDAMLRIFDQAERRGQCKIVFARMVSTEFHRPSGHLFHRFGQAEFIVGAGKSHAQVSFGFLQTIFRRDFLVRNGIRYDERNRFGEDFLLYLDCLLKGGFDLEWAQATSAREGPPWPSGYPCSEGIAALQRVFEGSGVDDRVVFVDWPHARRGAPVIDLVTFLSSVAADGIDPRLFVPAIPPARSRPASRGQSPGDCPRCTSG